MVNMEWTPPSGVLPSAFSLNLASRTGPPLVNEARQMVRLLQILLEEIELWIEVRRACTTDGRLSVTAGAAIEVHSRPQAVRTLSIFLNSSIPALNKLV